jgi:hypothetical protein
MVLQNGKCNYNLIFSRDDSPETLMALIASCVGVPIDTIRGLEDKINQRNYSCSPYLLPEDGIFEILTSIPSVNSFVTKDVKSKLNEGKTKTNIKNITQKK